MYNQTSSESLSCIYMETQLKDLQCCNFYYFYNKCADDFAKQLPNHLLEEFENLSQIYADYYYFYQEDFENFLFNTLKSIKHFKPTKKCKN